MSYLQSPRIHFSGQFKASPSTINNTPNNYNPEVYPKPNELEKVELYWNPMGDGGFTLKDCFVTRIEFPDGRVATTSQEDPLVGQVLMSVKNPAFPMAAGMVDLDPMQQNVSEIWALALKIGDSPASITANFAEVAFYSIWGQAQGKNAPRSSASASGVYQSTLLNVEIQGSPSAGTFIDLLKVQNTKHLSINFNTTAHNNRPPIYRFNCNTLKQMQDKGGVPQSVIDLLTPLTCLIQNVGSPRGDVPTLDFTLNMLKQLLPPEEYNEYIEAIIDNSTVPYIPATPNDFLYGSVTGTIGLSTEDAPRYFVPSRMMSPPSPSSGIAYFTPFRVESNSSANPKSSRVVLNLGNSLPTELPGLAPYAEKLGRLWLVCSSDGTFNEGTTTRLAEIPYSDPYFMSQQAGFCTIDVPQDLSTTPLGIQSDTISNGVSQKHLLVSENPQGLYLRADQFVFRMNPQGIAGEPRGSTATVNIHALKFGKPVDDGTTIQMTKKTEEEAKKYTLGTLATSGTRGIENANLSVPQDKLEIKNQAGQAATKNGVATFELSCSDPGNPRKYVNGQIYFLNYTFADSKLSSTLIQDPNDIVSVQVYDATTSAEADAILAKYGRLYKIMGFLADQTKVEQIDRRNMIKIMLEKPLSEIQHMPVTRDLGDAERNKIVEWIDALNNQ